MSGYGLFTEPRLPVHRRILPLLIVVALIVPVFIAILPGQAMAETIAEGEYSGDNTWTDTSTPYYVDGNITIPSGSSLTISPGVTVDIKEGCWIDVQGSLMAAGTDESPIIFTNLSGDRWSQLNVSSGGSAYMDHVNISWSSIGLKAMGNNSLVRFYNSTIHDPETISLTARDLAVIWCINSTKSGLYVSVSGGAQIHEGYWLRVRTLLDNGGGPFTGSRLNLKITYASGPDKVAYDSLGNAEGNDPVSDSNGNFPLIPVERYFHNGSTSSFPVLIRIKLDADESSDLMRTWGTVDSHITLSSNLEYVWWMDNIPPPDPTNFTLIENGGIPGADLWINIGWEWDFDATEHQLLYFVLSSQKKIGGDWVGITTDRMDRSYNFTDLEGSTIYEFKMVALDNNGNPSNETDVIEVMTKDIVKPGRPDFIEVVIKNEVEQVGGTWAELKWGFSASKDAAGYILIHNETGGGVEYLKLEGRFNNNIRLENLTSETRYIFSIQSYDSADPPNLSDYTGPVEFTTLDITVPMAPELKLYLVEETQYIEGSGIFNTTLVGLNVTVPGEGRTHLEILMNGEVYENPNTDIKWSTRNGYFDWVMFVDEGFYNISVRSIDPAGNEGEYSYIEFLVDLTPCTVEIFDLANGEITVDSGMDFNLRANVTDDTGVDSIKWYVQVGEEEKEYTGYNVSIILDPGEYDARLETIDSAGNVNISEFTLIALVPDHIFPRVVSTDPVEGGTVSDLVPSIMIEFSEEIIWEILSFDLGYVDEGGMKSVPLNIHFDLTNNSVVVTPKERLVSITNYTLVIRSITDLRGNTGDDFYIRFVTIDELLLDSDGDGIPDSVEAGYVFLDPYDPSDGAQDQDNDGLNNSREFELNTDIEDPDTDGDRMYDGWEVENNLNPHLNTDATVDSDGDGFENWEEFLSDTDPWDIDSKPDTSPDDDNMIIWILAVIAVIVVLVVIVMVALVILKTKGKEEETVPNEIGEGTEEPMVEEPVSTPSDECPQCGASIDEGMEFCPECGTIIPPVGGDLLPEEEDLISSSSGIPESPGEMNLESPGDMTDEEMDMLDETGGEVEPPSMEDIPR